MAKQLTRKEALEVVLEAACNWRDEMGGDIIEHATEDETKGYEQAMSRIDQAVDLLSPER